MSRYPFIQNANGVFIKQHSTLYIGEKGKKVNSNRFRLKTKKKAEWRKAKIVPKTAHEHNRRQLRWLMMYVRTF